VDAVAEGIRKVLLSDRTELGRRGREYVEKHLTWPAVVDKLDELYQSILQK
jgi:glycosyltransferase involved in cell wall biosynthesis